MQMLRATMLIDTIHAALEHAEEAFNRVRASFATDVFVLAVVNGHVFRKLLSNLAIHKGFVSGEARFRGNVLPQRLLDTVERLAGDVKRTRSAVTLNQREHHVLVTPSGTAGSRAK